MLVNQNKFKKLSTKELDMCSGGWIFVSNEGSIKIYYFFDNAGNLKGFNVYPPDDIQYKDIKTDLNETASIFECSSDELTESEFIEKFNIDPKTAISTGMMSNNSI